ncbi:MAG: hypothetical protein LBR85_01410 [Oscillospiraceae bacterium]|jgi:predicted membrane protein|nr:hypothetical protein [Oscillospiraceae bacterium]
MRRNWFWGTFLLLAAAFILATRFMDFAEFGVGSAIGLLLCAAVLVQTVASKVFAGVAFPLAIMYYILHTPLGWPHINIWMLLLAALLATIGLAILLPKKPRHASGQKSYSYSYGVDVERDGDSVAPKDDPSACSAGRGESGGDDDEPFISSSFSGVNRYLQSQNLRGGTLSNKFGALEIYMNNAKLAPGGATFNISSQFGAIKLYVPKEWQVIDNLTKSFGTVDMKPRFSAAPPDAPALTLVGSVSMGAVEVVYV